MATPVAITGTGGMVNGASTIRDWSVSAPNDAQALIASNTKGGTVRIAGNDDWSGSYNAYGHTPASFAGDALAFKGRIHTVETIGLEGTAIVDSFTINWDIEGGGIIDHTVNFSGNGVLTHGTITAVSDDSSNIAAVTAIGTKAEYSAPLASPSYLEILNIRTMSLTVTADNKSFTSSSTGGGTRRVAGNIDCDVSISLYTDNFDLLDEDPPQTGVFDAGTIAHLRLFVTNSTFWDIDFILWGEKSDMNVNVETGDPVSMTLNGSFTGFAEKGGAPPLAEGFIKDPATNTKWPA